MSARGSQGNPPSLVAVLKLQARHWRSIGEDAAAEASLPQTDSECVAWCKDTSAKIQADLLHPIRTLFRLIEKDTSFLQADIEWAAWFMDRPLERTPPKPPGDAFIRPDRALDDLGLPEEFATGADLQNLRLLHEELHKCDTDGRTAMILSTFEAEHPGVLTTPTTPQAGAPPPSSASLPLARHSPDFRAVHWFGTDYTFTPTQAACVKVLWQAWDNGTPDVGQAAILENVEVDSASEKLRDVFKRHPALNVMIVGGSTRGAWRLKEPGN